MTKKLKRVAQALVSAYGNGEDSGGSVDWADLDDVVELARAALEYEGTTPVVLRCPMCGSSHLRYALDSVCTQRKASHVLVSSAYTSQLDSMTGLLHGERVGDKFYRVNGDVLQADHNAARNVLARLFDKDIGRFTPYQEVRRILLARSPAELTVNRHELQPKGCQPCAEKPQRSVMINV